MTSRVLLVAAAVAAASCARAPVRAEPPAPPVEVTLEAFDRPLAEYGEWIVVVRYGRVWRPLRVAAGWQPYLHGEWVWTSEGWFWLTDEPWGWATYHYGRWAFDPVLGWVWVPGFVWAPAWVAWRIADGFVGWAPLHPGFAVWWVESYPLEPQHWIFVPTRHFVGVRIEGAALPRSRAADLIRSSRPAPPPTAGRASPAPPRGGPPHGLVEEHVGRPVNPARIVTVPSPADARRRPEHDAVPAYRPAPERRPAAAPGKRRGTEEKEGKRPAPARP